MLVLALVLGCLSVSWGQKEEITLSDGQEVVIRSSNYPENSDAFVNKEWSLTGPSGKVILLSCSHFITYRITDYCDEYGLHIESGGRKESYCGNLRPFKVESQGNHMKVRLEIGKWSMGKVDCVATTAEATKEEITTTTAKPVVKEGPVTRVHVKFNENAYLLRNSEYPEHSLENFPKWIITTDPGYKVGVFCNDVRFPGGDNCAKHNYGVKLEYEGGEKTICSPGGVISVGEPEVTVTILKNMIWPNSGGTVSCRVNSLKTDKALQYFHAVESEEEDSSEHGVVPGNKGTSCKCGWANKQSQRIVDGKTATPNEYPFMAALLHKGSQNCGASIITSTFTLSAAHCTVKYDVEHLKVGMGIHDLHADSKWTQTIQVIEKIEHPNYNKDKSYGDDIVLLRLERPIEYNDMVGPICMPKNIPANMNNKKITVMGWGLIDQIKGILDTELQKAPAHIVDPVTCRTTSAPGLDIERPLKMCYYGTNTSSTCSGDSGSPIVWVDPETNRFTQLSLVSYHLAACVSHNPSVGTYVINYLDWIRQHVQEEMCMKED